MDAELKQFEEELGRLSPRALPDGLIARMEAAMEGWADDEDRAGDDKVVPFPPVARPDVEPVRRERRGTWAAAAAVALLGALAGLFFTSAPESNEAQAEAETVPNARVSEVVFDNQPTARRELISTNDAGVVYSNGMPVRVMRLNYVDRIEFRSDDGREVHMEQPAVNYVLIPVPTD